MKQFEIWTCNFGKDVSYGDWGIRPCIIVSNDTSNLFSNYVTVVPITTQTKSPQPTHCIVKSSKVTSFAMCETIVTIKKEKLGEKVGELTEFEKLNIKHCLKEQLGLN